MNKLRPFSSGFAFAILMTLAASVAALPVPDTGTCNSNTTCFQISNAGSSSLTTGILGFGVTGVIGSASGAAVGNGVEGSNGFPGGSGVYGHTQAGTGYGVAGRTFATNSIAVYGDSQGKSGSLAGKFDGNVSVNGTLSKSAGSFVIDHPLDRANKILRHSFVESPEMLNVYSGTVKLSEHGEAWVDLPAYFSALNRDYRYQLTNVGAFAATYVAEEVRNNRFRIAGGKAGMKVSWQVSGVRQDAYAADHRIVVEEEKDSKDRGTFLYARTGEPQMITGSVPLPAKRSSPSPLSMSGAQ